MSTEIAAVLGDRIDAYAASYVTPFLEHRDPTPALSPNALVEADRLWEFSQDVQADGLVPAIVGQILGQVRQIRARALLESDRRTELVAAAGLFSLAAYGQPADEVDAKWRWLIDDGEAMALQAHYILDHRDISGPPMLDRAVELYRRALASCLDHPDRARWLSNTSLLLALLYLSTGQRAELDDAVRSAQEAVDAWPTGEPVPVGCHLNLKHAAWLRYELTNDLADLDLAVAAVRTSTAGASRLAAGDAPPLADRLDWLARLLDERARRTGNRRDLDEAVQAARDALAANPADDPGRPHRLVRLAALLHKHYLRSGDDVVLDTAVRHAKEAAAAADSTGRHYGSTLAMASEIFAARHVQHWSVDDVEAAVRVGRAAVDATPPGHPDRAHTLWALAAALERQFTAFNDPASLDEAVRLIRESVALTSSAGLNRTDGEDLLIHLLYRRGARDTLTAKASEADLDEAVLIAQRRAARTVAGDPMLPSRLFWLALVLHSRSRLGGADRSVDRSAAIATVRRSLATSPPDDRRRGPYRALLAAVLFDEFEATGSRDSLQAALEAARHAALDAERDDGRPDAEHATLAAVLSRSFIRLGSRAHVDEAVGLWRTIAAEPSQAVVSRMAAARNWAALSASMGKWSEAVEGYELAVALLPLLAWRGLDVAGRERHLAEWGGLAQDAAACSIAAGQPDRAVVLLDQGRSVLWAQVLASQDDLGALRRVAPGLADQLAEVRAELDRYSVHPDSLQPDAMAFGISGYGPPGDRRMTLARQFDALLAEARQLPGMGSLLRAPDVRGLYPATAGGAFIVVNSSRWRCDAIVVTERAARVVPLPRLTHDDVLTRTRRHLDSVHVSDSGGIDDVNRLDAVIAREEGLADLLGWLWDAVAEPVLRAVGWDTPRPAGVPWPRVWWCPTGLLSMLPLHAAGRHDTANGRRAVLDLVVSSYAPSLRMLAMARSPYRRPTPGRILMVAAPHVPGQPVLRHAAEETDVLQKLLPGGPHTLVSGTAATRDRVLAELAAHPWVHFICHGSQNLTAPATGGLALRDGRLTVADLTASDAIGGEFAFLSACDTALGGVHLPDESITLAAALHHIGYRRVVGTLWPTLDSAAAELVHQTYRRLTGTGRFRPEQTADALHEGVRTLRAAAPTTPSTWASFVHIGA